MNAFGKIPYTYITSQGLLPLGAMRISDLTGLNELENKDRIESLSLVENKIVEMLLEHLMDCKT